MAIDLTTEQRKTGTDNFERVAEGLTRRDFMKSMAIAGTAVVPASAAVYFGYKLTEGHPVKAAIIGTGDEGGVLVGEHNPAMLEFIACCDIRPSNIRRIFDGDPKVPQLRKGFKRIYGQETAVKQIKVYDDYQRMFEEVKDLEAVVIALPLHLHAPVAIAAMQAGQRRGRPIHVLCEKLMAWNISQCKDMIRVAEQTGSILSIGHQRHYSMLYAHAQEVIASGILGDIKHIRALWHRNNTWPRLDLDGRPVKDQPLLRDGWCPEIPPEDRAKLESIIRKVGYKSMEELVRWRLFNRTGGGLMAELGSHQLDACSIFLGKKHPLAVMGVGGRYFYGEAGKDDGKPNPRESDDHVFVTYEFPGAKYHPKDNPDDLTVVTYSSINTNGFEPYGETVMGSRGTLIVEAEASLMLYSERDPNKKGGGAPKGMAVGVSGTDKPALDASSTWGPPQAATGSPGGGTASASTATSRGYREEMEDFAYCVRLWDAKLGYATDTEGKFKQRLPRCHGKVAMADAIIALTANKAMRTRQRIEFQPEWFDPKNEAVPDAEMKPEIVQG